MIDRKVLAGGFLIAIGLSLGFGIGSLRAGVPATNPLLYSGSLVEAGQPVTGARNIRVSLWRHETDTTVGNRTCETVANNTPVEGGRFRVVLDPTCVTAVHAEPEQWVELEVGGTVLGTRAKLGAVPYALEAQHALEAQNAVNARQITADGQLGEPVTGALGGSQSTTEDIVLAPDGTYLLSATVFGDQTDFHATYLVHAPHAENLNVSFQTLRADTFSDGGIALATQNGLGGWLYNVNSNFTLRVTFTAGTAAATWRYTLVRLL